MSRGQTKYYAFFNLLKSPNEHPNVGWVNLASTSEKIYVNICARWELMVTKCHVSESCFLQGFYILMNVFDPKNYQKSDVTGGFR